MQKKAFRQIIKRKIALITVACTLFGCEQPNKQAQSQSHTQIQSQTQTQVQSQSQVQAQEQGQTQAQTQTQAQIQSQGQTQVSSPELEFSLKQAGLVDIQSIDGLVLVNLKYSTTDNFVGVDVYGNLDRCYLQPPVANMLSAAQQELSRRNPGYRLLLYDCARPLSVQQILWDTLQKPDDIKHLYVADPQEGSIHNYGSAVDLTIANEVGQPLDMGTGYDYFGELAYPSKEEELLASGDLSAEQIENRKLLREIMASAGFTPITSEWWHFNAYSRERAAELFEIIE